MDILLRVHDLNDSNVSLATAQAYVIGGIELTRTQDVPLSMDLTSFPYWPTPTNTPEIGEEEG